MMDRRCHILGKHKNPVQTEHMEKGRDSSPYVDEPSIHLCVSSMKRDIIDIFLEAILAQKRTGKPAHQFKNALKNSCAQVCLRIYKPGPGAGVASLLKPPKSASAFYRRRC